MLWHTAPAWQLCVPSSHSSTSARETRPHVRGWWAPAHTSLATTLTLQRSPASRGGGCRGLHIGDDDVIPLTAGHSETYSVWTGT